MKISIYQFVLHITNYMRTHLLIHIHVHTFMCVSLIHCTYTCIFSGTTTAPTMPEYCTLPPVSGMCEAYMPSFFYNATSGMCESFVYGGCGGNDNRFGTYEDCLLKCGKLPTYIIYNIQF